MSKRALKDYGILGKLVKQGTYYEPMEPLRTAYGSFDSTVDAEGLNKTAYLEDMKEWRKEKARIKRDIPKIFALMLQYLSDESL
jgi:hypothetical protein